MKNLFTELNKNNLTKPCIIYKNNIWSYLDFFEKVNNFSSYLINNNLQPGDRIGLMISSPDLLLVAYYSSFKTGIIPVPIPFSDQERIDGAVISANLKALVGKDLTIEQIFLKNKKQLVDSNEAMVIFTSGTTSKTLKGVRLSHSGISNTCSFMNSRMEINSQIIECVCATIDHAFGFGRCHAVLSIGGTINIVSLKNGLGVLFDSMINNQCNALSAPPSILSSMIRVSKNAFSKIKDNIQWLQTGAMRFDPTFRKTLIDLLPETRIFMHYGLSEAMRVTFYEINKHKDKLNTEGPPSDGVEICILDDNNNILPKDQEGSIAIKGKNLCLGYLNNSLWEEMLYKDWFVTSDVGKLDQDGFLVFCGRSDDTINCNGVLVHPDEIELKLSKFIQDTSFSVLGILDPHAIKDGIIVLCVEGESTLTKAELVSFMSTTDKHLIPQKIISVPEFPRTRSGKVNRSKLREALSVIS